jgi:hypothetical protein
MMVVPLSTDMFSLLKLNMPGLPGGEFDGTGDTAGEMVAVGDPSGGNDAVGDADGDSDGSADGEADGEGDGFGDGEGWPPAVSMFRSTWLRVPCAVKVLDADWPL